MLRLNNKLEKAHISIVAKIFSLKDTFVVKLNNILSLLH